MALVTITGSANAEIAAQCSVPGPGDDVTSDNLQAFAQSVENDLDTIRKRLGATLETFVHAPWFVDGLTANGSGAQSTIPSDKSGVMYLPAPHGSKLVEVKIRFVPNTHSNLPGTMPKWTLYKIDGLSGSISTLATKTDPSGSTVSYNSAHYVSYTLGTPEQIDHQSYVYVLQVDGEGGTDKDDMLVGQPVLALL